LFIDFEIALLIRRDRVSKLLYFTSNQWITTRAVGTRWQHRDPIPSEGFKKLKRRRMDLG
jgi:hypothetical protein